LDEELGREVFFICPFGNAEVDHNYEFVVKPVVEKYGFTMQRADEISNTQTITQTIVSAINRARFVVADLTEARPNCYYEVGYAHAIGKPVVVLAKTGSERHFDLAAYNWTHWDTYKDLKPKLEKRVDGVLAEIGLKA
jgi:nucleoside 2-deoxyribosyltransferase